MKDWSEYVVVMQPLARKLEEHLNRREFKEAAEVAKELENCAFSARLYCATHLDEE